MQYVTYDALIQFGLLIVSIIGLVYEISHITKNNRPCLENFGGYF